MIEAKTLITLEFNKILELIAGETQSECGRIATLSIIPCTCAEEARNQLLLADEALLCICSYNFGASLEFDDLVDSVERARMLSMLTPAELLAVARTLKTARLVKSAISACNAPNLSRVTNSIMSVKVLEDEINKVILSETEISDHASSQLYSIRRKIRNANDNIRNKLNSYIKTETYSKYLQDNIITMRNGRYVLPVRAECRSSIGGLVHDRSSSGATVFMEPIAIVEMNNELRTLLIEEEAEIERIIAELTAKVAASADALLVNQAQLTELDVYFAKARYALKSNAVVPIIEGTGKIKIEAGRHPLLGALAVPLDIEIDGKIIVVSGPNTGGKTVALKTVGLFALLASSGIFVPAKRAHISFFDGVFCDIGDEQSIENALSTFSSHLTNIIKITSSLKSGDLVLLDEIGAGTDPVEGAALAVGIVKHLIMMRCVGIVTTHYDELKEFSIGEKYIENASMQFDPISLRPTYRLITGLPGSSRALEIARRLGLAESILCDAESSISAEKKKIEDVLREAENAKAAAILDMEACEKLRRQAEQDANELQRERARYNALYEETRANARAIARKTADAYLEEASELIEELKEKLKEGTESALLQARRLKNQITVNDDGEQPLDNSIIPVVPEKLKPGDAVIIRASETPAKVVSIDHAKGTASVLCGSIRADVKVSALGLLCKKVDAEAQISTSINSEPPRPIVAEIKLLGKTVVEAICEIEDFLLTLPPASELKIIHGIGTGALRKAVHGFLKGNPQIKEFRLGRHGEGGAGVTLCVLK